jgi:hypothetical protein
VQRETERLLQRSGVPATLPPDLIELLVTTFHELRASKTAEGKTLEPLSMVMSTAEAVSVGYAAGIHAYYNGGNITPAHLLQSLLGSAIKDAPEDRNKLRHYFNHVVKERGSPAWCRFYEARHEL